MLFEGEYVLAKLSTKKRKQVLPTKPAKKYQKKKRKQIVQDKEEIKEKSSDVTTETTCDVFALALPKKPAKQSFGMLPLIPTVSLPAKDVVPQLEIVTYFIDVSKMYDDIEIESANGKTMLLSKAQQQRVWTVANTVSVGTDNFKLWRTTTDATCLFQALCLALSH